MTSEQLRPQFFVTRQNGNMVPLIAMDELPSTVNIRNVSRSLSPYDVSGMTGIGTFEARHLHHVVEPSQAGQLIDRSIMGTSTTAHVDRTLMASKYAAGFEHHLTPTPTQRFTNINGYPAPPKAYGIHEQPPLTPTSTTLHPIRQPQAPPPSPTLPSPIITATPPQGLTNNLRIDRNAHPHHPLPTWHSATSLSSLGLKPAPGVKKYCSYWLRHGECDYAQQGCLYKHEMPLDRATLERLGLRDIPRWYREKHGLGSYLAAAGAGASEGAGVGGGLEGAPSGAERKRKEEMMNQSSWRKEKESHRRRESITVGMDREFEKLKTDGAGSGSKDHTTATRRRLSNSGPGNPRTHPSSKLQTAKAIQMRVPEQKSKVMETERDRQLRKTIAELDRWEEQERLWKAKLAAIINKGEEDMLTGGKGDGKESSSESSTPSPMSATFDKAAVLFNAEFVDTPATSAGSSESEAVGVGVGAAGAGAGPAVGVKQAQIMAKAGNTGKRGPVAAAMAGMGRGSKMKGARQPRSRRRLAPPSESGESMMTKATMADKKEKVEKEVDLLEGYDHDD